VKKQIVKSIRLLLFMPFHFLNGISSIYSKFLNLIDPNGSERYWEELTQRQIDKRINSGFRFKHDDYETKIFDKSKKLKFYTPSRIASYRAHTFFSKEKDTLEWIEKYGDKNKVFFDIGANIGVYTLFYAATHNSKVYSFEPSFRNLDLLVRNIVLNNLSDNISIISNPVFDRQLINNFSQARNIAGMSEATFGSRKKEGVHNYFSRFNEASTNYKTLSISIDKLIEDSVIQKPNLIKIDVDGNEIEVLKGARKTIESGNCNSILVETRNDTTDVIGKILTDSGFKRSFDFEHKDITKVDDWNEIWLRG
tara:strand:- start:30 stop:956 length:927 start_codon:yes stop_codon:yes gene_type:complete